MNDRFKLTLEVDEIVELSVRIPFSGWSQRENNSYTDYKLETKKFASLDEAKQRLSENSAVQVQSAVLVRNIIKEFSQ